MNALCHGTDATRKVKRTTTDANESEIDVIDGGFAESTARKIVRMRAEAIYLPPTRKRPTGAYSAVECLVRKR